MQPTQPYNVVICSRHVAEDFASLVCCPWLCNSSSTEVRKSRGSAQQSLTVHFIHQMARVCRVKSAQTAATSSVCLAAGNETCCLALSTVAGGVHFTTARELADLIGSVALVCRASAQGLPAVNWLCVIGCTCLSVAAWSVQNLHSCVHMREQHSPGYLSTFYESISDVPDHWHLLLPNHCPWRMSICLHWPVHLELTSLTTSRTRIFLSQSHVLIATWKLFFYCFYWHA